MEQLDVDIVPYIVLLVVPVLGRMSDPSDSIRFMATQCFATLIRLLPLEVGALNWKALCKKWNHFQSLIHLNILSLSWFFHFKFFFFPLPVVHSPVYPTPPPCLLT